MAEYSAESARKIAGNIKVWQSEIDDRQEAIDNAKATLAQWYEDGTNQEGRYDIIVYTHKAFNAAQAKKVLTAEEYNKASVSTVTSASVKAAFGEDSPQFLNSQKSSDKKSVQVDIRDETEEDD